MSKITILGAGAWGTAMATLLTANGHAVTLWCFEDDLADEITANQANTPYFSGIKLDSTICATSSLQEAVTGADFIFEAVPVTFLRETLQAVQPYVTREQSWVCLSKGIEDETLLFPFQMVQEMLSAANPRVANPRVAVLSGPNFAYQIAKKALSAALVASHDKELRLSVANLCANTYFKPYLSSDPIGASVGGALKNVISLFLGMVKGSGHLENTMAFLATRGLKEIATLTDHLGGKAETIYGLAGLGDLMLGLVGRKNRNYEAGILLGQGKPLVKKILPEGIGTVKSLHQILEKNKISLPICKATYELIYEAGSMRDVLKNLMAEPVGDE